VSVFSVQLKTRPSGRVFACKGFTTVELIVVILILGIIAVVGGSRFFYTDRFSEMGFADTVANSLRYAHKLAMVSGCDTRAQVTANSVALFQKENGCDSGDLEGPVMRPGGTAWTETAPAGVTVTSPVDIYFDAYGSPFYHASDAKLTSPATMSVGVWTITVEAETGYVHR